ncbi:MAG: hypothetical protein JWR69_4201 [Pedosphaera sp.]|nr:hypothetical protein [Pedosphaera sp.]
MGRGFLGTNAPLTADLTLMVELGMGLALLVGAGFARRKRYRAHAWVQSTVVLLNLLVIGLFMAPSFRSQVLPELPGRLGRSYFALATAHGVLGMVAELFACYILLVAGTNLLPPRLRFTRYRPWMRAALALWWFVLILGLATYIRWYGVPFVGAGGAMLGWQQGRLYCL